MVTSADFHVSVPNQIKVKAAAFMFARTFKSNEVCFDVAAHTSLN